MNMRHLDGWLLLFAWVLIFDNAIVNSVGEVDHWSIAFGGVGLPKDLLHDFKGLRLDSELHWWAAEDLGSVLPLFFGQLGPSGWLIRWAMLWG
jgi:hypothetical protein